FIDSKGDHPGLNENEIEKNITKRTKAIVAVHYAGVACDMDKIMQIAEKYDLFVVEDAAQAIDSYYMDKHLGGIGDFGCFSFHETKNIHCGEGGLLTINNPEFKKRSEIIWEKGTNRAEFFRGEVNKYGWVDIGSSFLPSEMNAAFLYAQIENLNNIQNKRKAIWKQYYKGLKPLEDKGYLKLPVIPEYATNNAHMFYLVCNTADERTKLIQHLKKNGVHAVFHYLSLHKSDYYEDKHDGRDLPNADIYTDCLVRLPMYYGIKREEIKLVVRKVREFWLL
nr:dTDP-4-amino-4,6-dideoxygalactose transaminase [Pelagibacterales bacterium]